ncbi:NAD(+) diphosphatase [Azospirillum sp. SYSU D00513]|uniref:NAD(+) diphosphatase n=1 Tax=Azospirillum sp. SYSU D00513 TaxID=2812561 RepID=UPI001A96EE9F|nr:NAD(+) diphosphatase [Azospirillum sp. SYSU D00513]
MTQRLNKYAGGPIDRAAHRRKDPDWLADAQASPRARALVVSGGRSLVGGPAEAPRAVFLPLPVGFETAPVFLGLADGAPLFALDLSADLKGLEAPEEHPALAGHGRFEDLRAVGPLMPDGEASLCAYARGITWWNARHHFCGVCGAPAEGGEGGHVRLCTNPDCGTHHFPRTDPAVIMLVHDGADRVVLGRNARFPPGMHSVLAGFVETGEALEEAVAREVMEEVGLPVTDVQYHSSQPWPFPASIMLGFSARAVSLDIRVDENELESARWFTRDFLRDVTSRGTNGEEFRLPRQDSIARRLLDEWIAEE